MMNKWVFNTPDPNNTTIWHTWHDERGLAWFLRNTDPRVIAQNKALLHNRFIGEPQVPDGSDVTIEELKAMGLVGVYELP